MDSFFPWVKHEHDWKENMQHIESRNEIEL